MAMSSSKDRKPDPFAAYVVWIGALDFLCCLFFFQVKMVIIFFLFKTSIRGGQNTSHPTLAGVRQLLQDIKPTPKIFDKNYEKGGIAFVKVDTQERAWAPGLWLVFLKVFSEVLIVFKVFSFQVFLFFLNSFISQFSKKAYDVLYDSGCNLGSHVPWKEVPGAGGKLPLLRPTPSSNDGPDRQQREANKVARAKTKVSKRSQSMELLGLIVFFPRCSFVFFQIVFLFFFYLFSSCQFVFFFRARSPSPPHAAAARGVRDLSPLPPPDSPPPPSAKSEVVAPRYRSRFFSDLFLHFLFQFSIPFM